MVLPDNQVSSPKSVLDNETFENSSNESDFDANDYLNDDEDNVVVPQTPNEEVFGNSIYCENIINMINSIKDLREENRDMFSSINETIKLMLAVATNMSCVIENDIKKEESKDNLKEWDTLKVCDMVVGSNVKLM
ncbi:hypothetical protein Tco_0529014 [Tanacetum coccineum]